MKQTEEQFFELLRSGLWNRPADVAYFEEKTTDWDTIYRLSKEQTVMGVVYDGMITLPNELRPEKKMKLRWYAQVGIIERKNKELNSVLVDVFTRYKAQGFTPVLLKGQGVAALYPHPLHRQCGDIDVLVGEEDYEKCNEYAMAHLARVKGHNIGKHYDFRYRNVVIENHKYAILLVPKSVNQTFQSETNLWFPKTTESSNIEGEIIPLPPPDYHFLLLLAHIFYHFFEEGVGLRQVCDLCLFIEAKRTVLDVEKISARIGELQLSEMYQLISSFCKTYMGLSTSLLYSLESENEAKTRKLLKFILKDGNMGHNRTAKRSKYYVVKKLQGFYGHIARYCEIFSVMPKATFWHCVYVLPNGVKYFFKDMR